MVQISLALPLPFDEAAIESTTTELQQVNKTIILESRDPDTGTIYFTSPESNDSDLEPFGELFQKWFKAETIMVYTCAL